MALKRSVKRLEQICKLCSTFASAFPQCCRFMHLRGIRGNDSRSTIIWITHVGIYISKRQPVHENSE